jgi:16S rRNA (cytosine1402-N4)-methyltransferase
MLSKALIHTPVMTGEVLESLGVAHLKGGRYIDATLGYGGHTLEILKNGGSVLAIELDGRMLSVVKKRIAQEKLSSPVEWKDYKLVLGNFKDIDVLAGRWGFSRVDGILYDLGVTGFQLTHPKYGFSFSNPKALLDMRFNVRKQKLTAFDLLNVLREDQLCALFNKTMSNRLAQKLSGKIIAKRSEAPFKTVGDLTGVVGSIFAKKGKLNPATKVFLALRIAVNSEMENLKESLPKAFGLLKGGGRLVVITFHSLEDRIVKDFVRTLAAEGRIKRELVDLRLPTAGEVNENPRARSAKMRVLTKIV